MNRRQVALRLDRLVSSEVATEWTGEFMGRSEDRVNSRHPGLCGGEVGFGRAVSRILSATDLSAGENHLSQQPYPEPVPLSRTLERAAPRFPIWPCTRWGFPCPADYSTSGGLLHHLFTFSRPVAGAGSLFSVALSVGTTRAVTARVYPEVSFLASVARGYAASRPVVFGLSSPGLRRERFSTLPKPP